MKELSFKQKQRRYISLSVIWFLLISIVFMPSGIAPSGDPPVADFTWSPSNPSTSDLIQFTDLSTDPDGWIKSWVWSFGDGNSSNEQHPTHTYADDGTYSVTLLVIDNQGWYDEITKPVQVSNTPPDADPGGPYHADIDEPISFDGTGSTDSDGSISSYAWDFGDGDTATGSNPTHTYTTAGEYTVSLTVTDDDGSTDTDTTTASINYPPTADAGGPYEGITGEDIFFDGSGSSDSDGTIIDYTWDFGDGHSETGETTTHTFTEDGEYIVTVTVTDDDSSTDTDTTTVTVINPDVVVDAGGPYTGQAGEPVSFTGSASEGTPPYQYLWDFGDENTSSEQNPSYSYAMPGTYEVTLSVVDDTGKMGWDTTEAIVEPGPISVIIDGPYHGNPDESIQFECTVYGGTSPYSFLWSFGDNCSSTDKNPVHQYTTEKTYMVTLTVTDAEMDTAQDTTTAEITTEENHPPLKPELSGPPQGKPGKKYMCTAVTTDPDDDPLYYTWNFSDREGLETTVTPLDSGENCTINHTFNEKGEYAVRVKAQDEYGLESEWSDPLAITMPKTKEPSFPFLDWLCDHFPFFEVLMPFILI